jgi:transposase
LTVGAGLSKDESHGPTTFPQHRVQTTGCTGVHCRRDPVRLSKRHDISRQLIRVWVQKYEAGALDEDAQAADLLQEYEAKMAALERMVGRQALEIEFLKGALKNAPRPRNANTSVIAGPAASPSQKDAG